MNRRVSARLWCLRVQRARLPTHGNSPGGGRRKLSSQDGLLGPVPLQAPQASQRPRPPHPRGHALAGPPPPAAARPRGLGLQAPAPAHWRRGPAPRLRLVLAHIALGELAPPSALPSCPPATAASISPRPRRSHSARPQNRKPVPCRLGHLSPTPGPHPLRLYRAQALPPRLPSQKRGPRGHGPSAAHASPTATPEGGRASLFQRRAHGLLPSPPSVPRTHPVRSLRLPEFTPTRWQRAPFRGARSCNWWIF